MRFNKEATLIIIRDLFIVLFVLFIVFSFLELLKPQIVFNYLDLNLYILILIILGSITALYGPLKEQQVNLKFSDYKTILLLSILIGLFIIYASRGIGYLSILVGLASFIMCFFLILLIFKSR